MEGKMFSIEEYSRECKKCNKNKPFRVFKIHQIQMLKLYKECKPIAESIMGNFNKSAPNGRERDPDRQFVSLLSGLMAERIIIDILKRIIQIFDLDIEIEWDTPSEERDFDYDSHTDMKLIFQGKNEKTVEVRSSPPYAHNLERILNVYFDIIGPYTTSYKSLESNKDYYGRVLFHVPGQKNITAENFVKILKNNNLTSYFVGGASNIDMTQKGESISDKLKMSNAKYIGIKPITYGRDAFELISIMLNIEEDNLTQHFKLK